MGTAPAEAETEVPPIIDRGVAGASARAERARRSANREARIRGRHPRIGGFLLAVSEDPVTTRVWDHGALGEEKVGAVLDGAAELGVHPLHDRRMPRSRANIDHLVVAPTGVWVVDAKRYTSGRLQRRDVGGWLRAEERLFVGRRDVTHLLDGVLAQAAAVTAALTGERFADIPVHGVLCFVDTELRLFAKPFEMRGVLVTWRKHLLTPMTVARDLVLDAGARHAVAAHLAAAFPAARRA